MWYVYILKCADGSYYTGCTGNLIERTARHNKKEVSYTASRLPIELISYFAFNEKHKAFLFEKYLKSGSGKAFAFKRLV
jgi:predicted GIY-YIG superfamily endonuclease